LTFPPTNHRFLLRLRSAHGLRKTPPALEALRASGYLSTISRLRRAPRLRDRHDPADEVLRLLPHRLGLHPLLESKNIPVGPGRGPLPKPRQLLDADHRYRSVQYGLLFERFLNPERISMPDIDIDFCMNRRGEGDN